ncbi:hypothetical protein BSK66_12485 [Paenibacillus odorifer]|uniref:hypothetical protein n=1 Tax=Paenibacillus TaxID=44249 RepID=UPI0003E2654E|nr:MULTISPECIES: hypothetical protein [Paenibacillus]ETT53897.1 hypothetical protein C171_20609 [Paenibacillus sp. FSL H8-237]OME58410.1 hypothetical protein BSK66_12485 [Paenibacillus odorifer]
MNYARISVSASVLVAYLETLSGGQWLTVLIGSTPPPGSLQAAPIAITVAGRKYHYPYAWVFALNGTAIYLLHEQNRSHSTGSVNKACKNKNRQNGRGAPAKWLSFWAMRGTDWIRLYLIIKESLRGTNMFLYYSFHFQYKIGPYFARVEKIFFREGKREKR